MRDDLVIRAAGSADADAITRIYRQAVLHGTGTFEIVPPDAAEMAARHARIVAAGYPFFVAADLDDILGYAYAFAFRDRQAYRFTVEDSVYVRDDAQRRGIGKALLGALLSEAEARGFRQMVAVVGDSVNVGSIRLHASAGFVHTGTWRSLGWKSGRWLDAVLMQRSLGDGDRTVPPTV